MALNLTGVNNRNEYYSQHYLLALLESDLKELSARWDQAASSHPDSEAHRPPPLKLRSLGAAYFRVFNRLERLHDPEARLAVQAEWLSEFLTALGYAPQAAWHTLTPGGLRLPLLAMIEKPSGAPLLWILPALAPSDEPGADPLTLPVSPAQYAADPERDNPQADGKRADPDMPWDELITRHIFSLEEPPRWVLLVSFGHICLLDRAKWPERRYLSFDLQEIYNRREESTLRATAALLHRESICPAEGFALLDTLDENSHRHAFSVSEDLKDAMRECVELLGNEAVWYLRETLHDKVFSTPDKQLEDQLTRGCLRFLYRLLFIHYLEARPELGYLPIKSDEYFKGYSLEALRDLEEVELLTDRDRDGYFFDRSIRILFTLIFEGRAPGGHALNLDNASIRDDFRIAPLKSHLFDPDNAPLIKRVRFRNIVLQEVVRRLSLGKQGRGRNARAGRISYAQLGINQLGAVYENLLSYSGFFAKTDLYEVKPADAEYDPLIHAYFVTEAELTDYRDEERVYAPSGADAPRRLLCHPKGQYIYRLAGRNREKSASYYTPESLTQCLVKYALKELLKDKTADDILSLTVCEMAVGSAAFLNEAVTQLADAYLRLKQKETGQTLAHDEYALEKQRVKMRLADNNVFGVDLNPTAVELAEVSLWLNTIYENKASESAHIPWFGLQLANGNSLVGARRQTFPAKLLADKAGQSGGKARWTETVPDRIPWPNSQLPTANRQLRLPPRPANDIYHWLVPDPGMSVYSDKVVKELKRGEIAAINAWRKGFCKAFESSDIETLKALSEAADQLWQRHLDASVKLRAQTTDELPVWPEEPSDKPPTSTQWKDEQLAKTLRHPYSPYRRLKLAMDYWCALWFWPIEQAALLPTRDQFLMELSVLLGVTPTISEKTTQAEFDCLLVDVSGTPQKVQPELDLDDPAGLVNVEELCRKLPRIDLVRQLAEKRRFFHWELEFVDVFVRRSGFDLIAGNPPWIKIEWNEGGLLSERNPQFAIRSLTASSIAELRTQEVAKPGVMADYLTEYEDFEGTQNFLNAQQNYPLLEGQQTNLYKCFISRAWELNSSTGTTGFLHPEGVYDDPNAGPLRCILYPRLRLHLQFQNEKKLFPDIGNRNKFSINVHSSPRCTVKFYHISNLFIAQTVDACFEHDGFGPVPGIKSGGADEDDDAKVEWNLAGHRDRTILVDNESLDLFSRIYDEAGTPPIEARLPALHSRQLVSVLRKFASYPKRLADLGEEYRSTVMWDETNSVKKDHTIRRETQFPKSANEMILSGPHFFVARPLHQTPKEVCETHRAYDLLDMETLPNDYLPRTNYIPACDPIEYRRRTPTVPWDDQKPVTAFYRYVSREMLSQSGERTLLPAIIPRSVGHIHTCISIAFSDIRKMVGFVASGVTLPIDFWVKTTGAGHANSTALGQLPLLPHSVDLIARNLCLNCLTSHYADLWSLCWDVSFNDQIWLGDDPRLDPQFWQNQTNIWNRDSALRTDFSRRWALIEMDVLVSRVLGLTLEELQTIYRIQFPVLRQNESDTWYDQKGRIVFTCSKGLPGVGFSRPEWNEIKDMRSGTVTRTVTDNTLPTGPVERIIEYRAPFTRCDREADYATVWRKLDELGQ